MITKNIIDIIHALDAGEVVGLPTETVYGLAANAFNEAAVNKIYKLKNRPFSNPLILHTHSIEEIKKYIHSNSKKLLEIGEDLWPGPLTIIFRKKDIIPGSITAGSKYVAFRIPNHPLILEVLRKVSYPIAAPSANPYQRISPTTSKQVYEYFGENIPYILEGGNCECGIESTIIGMENNEIIIYRQGSISLEQLKRKYQNVTLKKSAESKIKTSGMSKKHYAPNTKMIIVDSIEEYIQNNNHQKIGILRFEKMNAKSIAKNYYKKLYELDKAGFDIIISEKFRNTGMGRALNDKLKRAITKNEKYN